MSSTHNAKEPTETLGGPTADWLRVVVLIAAVLAGVVVAWSLLSGAERNLYSPAAWVHLSTLLPLL